MRLSFISRAWCSYFSNDVYDCFWLKYLFLMNVLRLGPDSPADLFFCGLASLVLWVRVIMLYLTKLFLSFVLLLWGVSKLNAFLWDGSNCLLVRGFYKLKWNSASNNWYLTCWYSAFDFHRLTKSSHWL